jgi:hypothetical protein
MKNYYVLSSVVSFLVFSCERRSSEENISLNEHEDQENSEGVINGNEWSLSDLSDFFDEGLTIDRVVEVFGDTEVESITKEGKEITELVYVVQSDKMHQNGVRLWTITIYFRGGVLLNVETGFTGISS